MTTATSATSARDRRAGVARDRPPCDLLHQRQHRRPKGVVLSHRANFLRSHPGPLLLPPRPDRVPVPALPHGGVDHRYAGVAARATWWRTKRATRRRSARRSNGIAPPGCTAFPGCGGASSTIWRHPTGRRATCRRSRWPSRRPRRRHSTSSSPSRTRCRTRTCASSTDPPKRGRWRRSIPSTSGASLAASACLRRWPRCASPPTVSCGRAAPSCSTATSTIRTPPPTRSSTAGTAPAISSRSTTRATSRWSVAPATSSAPVAKASPRSKWRRCSPIIRHVADVAVIGLPDAQWGEIICAVIVPAGDAPTVDELRAHCAGRLARFKHPRRVEVVDAIPRTAPTQQVQRRLLVDRFT